MKHRQAELAHESERAQCAFQKLRTYYLGNMEEQSLALKAFASSQSASTFRTCSLDACVQAELQAVRSAEAEHLGQEGSHAESKEPGAAAGSGGGTICRHFCQGLLLACISFHELA